MMQEPAAIALFTYCPFRRTNVRSHRKRIRRRDARFVWEQRKQQFRLSSNFELREETAFIKLLSHSWVRVRQLANQTLTCVKEVNHGSTNNNNNNNAVNDLQMTSLKRVFVVIVAAAVTFKSAYLCFVSILCQLQ